MAVDSEMVKRKLNDLRVVDLRAELDNRGIDKSGVKAVLIERLQQALLKEGHNPDDYLFEVVETPLKKNTKRTNKKLTRDDESETHSNVDEAPIDLCEEEGKFDSDDEVIDEKFFQVLETTDIAEDQMVFSIEEEEGKFLLDEEDVNCGAKDDDNKAQEENDHSKNGDGTDDRDRDSSVVEKKVNGIKAEGDNSTEFDSSIMKLEDDSALIVNLDESTNFLDPELASPTREQESTTMKEEDDDRSSSKASAAVSSKDADGSETKSNSLPVSSKVGDDSSSKIKAASPVTEKGSGDVSGSGDKQEDGKSSPSLANKLKSTVGSTVTTPSKETKTPDRLKEIRPVGSGKNLWVTGLSSTTRATDLKALFSKHGKVVGAKIVSNARSSGSRCYGFVTMSTVEDAAKCIQHLHRTELHGRLISVEKAKAEPVSSNRKVVGKPVVPVKKTPEKKEGTSAEVKEEPPAEKKADEGAEAKEKDIEKKDVADKNEKKTEESVETKGGSKEGSKDRDAERRKRSQRSESRKSSKERIVHRGTFNRPFVYRDRRPFRRPILHRPFGLRPRNPLTFRRITDERMRQRSRDYERKNREEERRRHQDMVRQREIERKQREESVRLERERERLRIEREKLERERAEVLRLEREKQRMERERIEREREELRKNRERLSGNRFEEQRRPVKRTFDAHAADHVEDRKRPTIGGARFVAPAPSFHNDRRTDTFERKADHFNDNIRRDINRRDPPVHDHDDRRPVRTERFERGPPSRDTDLRGHGRDDRGTSYRDSDSSNVHRPGPKDDWKQPADRRSGVNSSSEAYVGSGGRQGESRYVDRSSDSWQGHGGSQSDHRSDSKSYSSGGGIGAGPRDQWGGDSRKIDSGHTQSWGRSESVQGSRWGGMNTRGQQSIGIGQSMLPQSSIYGGPPSTVGQSNTMGMGSSASSSFSSDRFDTYKGPNSMRRY